MSRNERPAETNSFDNNVNLSLMAAYVLALPLELMLRRDFGRRYIGWTLLLSALAPLLFAELFARKANPEWGVVGFWIVLLMGVLHRGLATKRDSAGHRQHTQHDGFPALCLLGVPEPVCKAVIEPMLCIVAGIGLAYLNYSAGLFIGVCGVALGLKRGLMNWNFRERVSDLEDAVVEQQTIAERFRGR